MSKRGHQEDGPERSTKRSRQEDRAPVQEIIYARQLADILTFRQDGVGQLRDGIASFKAFLENVLYHRDENNRARQLSILREYLDSQRSPEGQETERPFLNQLWQAWSFADQNSNDPLASTIGAILAQLLKTLSTLLDFRDYGLLLCKTVLQHQHLRFLKRSLSAPSHKDFVISPTLRLLTEVSSFDGGIFARQVYKRRELTLDIGALRRNLGLVKTDIPEEELQRKPSIRTLTLRYVLTLLKYMHEGGKSDLLKNRPVCNALFLHIRTDPPEIVNEILGTIEQHVLKNQDVPRIAKANVLTQQSLQRVTEIAVNADHACSEKAFEWLRSVCTKSSYGVLRYGGWYPAGTSTWDLPKGGQFIDLGLDSIDFYDRDGSHQVRNTTLLSWMQTLHPHSNLKERELLFACFASAPELVSAYLGEKTLQMEPKLSNTWIGYASLLFEMICLPVPQFLGNESDWADIPPQTVVMLENILPNPLSQKVLVRCLNQSNELITFFAIRILVVALQKLDQVLRLLQSRSSTTNGALWGQAADRLLQAFIERSPTMKDIIGVFRQIPDDDQRVMQRESIARLLRLLYEVTPLQALEERFDISGPLTSALNSSGELDQSVSDEVKALRLLELEHMLLISRHNPNMRWFHKQGSLRYSPIVALLRLHVQDLQNTQVRQLVEHVLTDNYVLSRNDDAAATPVDALLASVVKIPLQSSVWTFVDECIARASRQPIKYIDILESIQAQGGNKPSDTETRTPSTLVAVVWEQASFVNSKPEDERSEQMGFVNRFQEIFALSSGDEKSMKVLRKRTKSIAGWESGSRKDFKISKDIKAVKLSPRLETQPVNLSTANNDDGVSVGTPFGKPPSESESHPELYRWSQKEFDLALEDGDIGALILCLCSHHSDIRMQAHAQLIKLMHRLRSESTHDNAKPISVLVGELCETFDQQCFAGKVALPYLAGTFAVRALRIQSQPSHWMYSKLNQYLICGPEWRIRRLPGYWLSKTVQSLPEDDDAYWREVQWVVDWLVDGLRTVEDLEILRRCDVFERLITLWTSSMAARRKQFRDGIFELLHRATYVDGGSNTLITRNGGFNWLETVGDTQNSAMCESLRRRIEATCEAEKLAKWAGGSEIRSIGESLA